ncbi:hypothetical protein E8E14_014575 [Neopestalotiopsis sp. 37M]|nr:hypothetical protein E8E14_014575 [Neopestalotiopsis sp. 37M]
MAIIKLRNHVDSQESPSQIQVLWTTLFLGLFELMHDSTGTGWVKHMVHGTFKAVTATGPAFFQSEPGRSFFAQARMFEACRAIIFNDATFLTVPDWLEMTRSKNNKLDAPDLSQHSFNSLLDIMAMCSRLSVQVGRLVKDHAQLVSVDAENIAVDLAIEGGRLRERLNAWQAHASTNAVLDVPNAHKRQDFHTSPEAFLTCAFFSATAIYLSGIFDYNMAVWKDSKVTLPTLDEQDIQSHVGDILHSTRQGLERTNLSHLLYLFPLRVAGARSIDIRQRRGILELYRKIQPNFSVAEAFEHELINLWERNPPLF